MSFEQYQFQRYYLPGSLFLIYFALLLMPFIDWDSLRGFMGGDFLPLVTLVTAAFVASPAIGYLLYCLYDPRTYNKRFMDWRRRRSLRLLLKWAAGCKPKVDDRVLGILKDSPPSSLEAELKEKVCLRHLQPSLKSTVDSLIHSRVCGEHLQISGEAANNLRGYWGHFAARFVCGLIVPFVASLLSFVLFLVLVVFVPYTFGPKEGGLFLAFEFVPSASWLWIVLQIAVIVLISSWIFTAREYPKSEAFELEYDMISSIILKQDKPANVTATNNAENWNEQVDHISLRENLNQRIREALIKHTICSDITNAGPNPEPIETHISKMLTESGLSVADLKELFEEILEAVVDTVSRYKHRRITQYNDWFKSREAERKKNNEQN